jgi:hypothetical protein
MIQIQRMIMVLFKKIEMWTSEGSWKHPSEWIFEITHDCPNGCLIIEIGFFGITILRNGCKG